MRLTKKDYNTLTQLRWLQVNELAIKYPNNQEFGEVIRELVKK